MGMKRRYLAVLMGIMVATTSVPAMVYAEDSKTEAAADAADESGEADASGEKGDESQENVVLGEVKSVSDSEITIAVGTMKEMGQPGGDGQNAEHRMETARAVKHQVVRMERLRRSRKVTDRMRRLLMERMRARMRKTQIMVILRTQRQRLIRIVKMQMLRMVKRQRSQREMDRTVEHRMITARVVIHLLCWI